ncbi:MAG TPA: tRNA pseudouridine(38-40) synthase TruA [Burkholderiaceae bacterium]|nr:tRNA pseudouridine(38-40) synthase TruA [Burkholderiaceae bacterium]
MAVKPSVDERWALGVSYRGTAYNGWQSQSDGRSIQDALELALSRLADAPVRTICAGRTDAGVHALNQVIHFDAPARREAFSWVRGTNSHLPRDIAVQWALPVPADFHARYHARGRRYRYVLLQSPVRPSLESGLVGWVFDPLEVRAMREAASWLIGEHDFSAFRASECQAVSPVKTLRAITIEPRGAYWRFEFDASAFLHHMVRNIMGCLLAVGSGRRAPGWIGEVLDSRDRDAAAPTFAADGLYFSGPYYDAHFRLPDRVPATDWLP